MISRQPTIKGMFVNSHIKAVQKLKGAAGVKKLEKRYGAPLHFRNLQDVPVREEVRLIELALDIISSKPLAKAEREFEAGRLHFRDFTTTPYGRIMFSSLPKNFKRMMMGSTAIAQHVFKGVKFQSIDLGPKAVKVVMHNNDYPIGHFQGLFYEWMRFFGLKGRVEAIEQKSTNTYEYDMSWQ